VIDVLFGKLGHSKFWHLAPHLSLASGHGGGTVYLEPGWSIPLTNNSLWPS
jgi:hypothetical protein